MEVLKSFVAEKAVGEDQHIRGKNSCCLDFQTNGLNLDGPMLGLDSQNIKGLRSKAPKAKDGHSAHQASAFLAQISPGSFRALVSRKGVASPSGKTRWKRRECITASICNSPKKGGAGKRLVNADISPEGVDSRFVPKRS